MCAIRCAYDRLANSGALKSGKLNKMPAAVVTCPGHAHAGHTFEVLSSLTKMGPVRTALVTGGTSTRTQLAQLRRGCDVLVATPGRLLDLLYSHTFPAVRAELLIMDAAFTMLSETFDQQMDLLWKHKIIDDNTMFVFVANRHSVKLEERVSSFLLDNETLLVFVMAP
ncbi:P-loop containing nucleoside triphosphate hydrolase protein [Phyllosticta paracitricarpa]